MQWHMGWFPNGYGNNLSWVKQIDNAIHPTNIVYTTHLYYYAPSDLTSYWATDYSSTEISTANRHRQHGRYCSIGNQRRRLMPIKLAKQTKRLTLVDKPRSGTTRLRHRRRSILLAKRLRFRRSIRRRNNAKQRLLTKQHGTSLHQRLQWPQQLKSQHLHQRQLQLQSNPVTDTSSLTPITTPVPTVAPTPEPTTNPRRHHQHRHQQPINHQHLAPTHLPKHLQPTNQQPQQSNQQTQPHHTTTSTTHHDHHIDVLIGFFHRHWFIFYWPRYNSWFAFHFW